MVSFRQLVKRRSGQQTGYFGVKKGGIRAHRTAELAPIKEVKPASPCRNRGKQGIKKKHRHLLSDKETRGEKRAFLPYTKPPKEKERHFTMPFFTNIF
jgi:hypothetical protein